MSDNVIYTLSKKFALRIVKLYNYLYEQKKEYVMSKQLYRCGTSIGANLSESIYAQSEADYISKLKIALKEASETKYWLELLFEAELLKKNEFDSLNNDINTIIGTLVNIINKLIRK
ncbi:MAG: four helix bundle protein [Prevotella sp.]|jgi:four helix bundle protein|nr:four helix bundle protein [Prevotella sp.]